MLILNALLMAKLLVKFSKNVETLSVDSKPLEISVVEQQWNGDTSTSALIFDILDAMEQGQEVKYILNSKVMYNLNIQSENTKSFVLKQLLKANNEDPFFVTFLSEGKETEICVDVFRARWNQNTGDGELRWVCLFRDVAKISTIDLAYKWANFVRNNPVNTVTFTRDKVIEEHKFDVTFEDALYTLRKQFSRLSISFTNENEFICCAENWSSFDKPVSEKVWDCSTHLGSGHNVTAMAQLVCNHVEREFVATVTNGFKQVTYQKNQQISVNQVKRAFKRLGN
eukprot:NODE_131_length_16689_cov_0.437914.p2 type:complete len:283 gc:universal NODE_131_length_16689_cov_0.437914:6729-5881(-)